jgi:hypothetical protein
MEIKISFYNVVNMFLIGIVFCGCLGAIFFNDIVRYLNLNLVKEISINYEFLITATIFALFYEIGLIINRLASVLFEELLKKIKLIKLNDYAIYKKAEKRIGFMKVLSREYAVSRNSMALFFILFTISLVKWKLIFMFIFLLLTVLFFFSMKKHSSKISELVSSAA